MAVGFAIKGLTAAAALGVVLWPVTGLTQDEEGGLKLRFSFENTVTADDNPDLSVTNPQSETRFDSRLGMNLTSTTRLQSLALSVDGGLRFSDQPLSTNSAFQDPSVRLAFTRDTGNSRISTTARYRKSDVTSFDPLTLPSGEVSTTDLIATTGTVVSYGAGVKLETGVNDPIGFVVSANLDGRKYSDTTDPDVYDYRDAAVSLTTRLRVSEITRVDVSLGLRDYDATDAEQTKRQTQSISALVAHELSPLVTVETRLGYSQFETDETILGVPVRTDDSGAFGSVEVMRDMANGTASFGVFSERDTVGNRNALRFSRDLDLPRGKLSTAVGLAARGGEAAQLVGTLNYTEELPAAAFNVALQRQLSLSTDDEDVLYTSLSLGYSLELSDVSGLGLTADWRRTEDGGVGAADTVDRQTLRATYSHDLTQDWGLTAGYQHRRLDDSASGKATSNSVFLTLGRSFDFRP